MWWVQAYNVVQLLGIIWGIVITFSVVVLWLFTSESGLWVVLSEQPHFYPLVLCLLCLAMLLVVLGGSCLSSLALKYFVWYIVG